MKKFFVKEVSNGRYHLQGFGSEIAGPLGDQVFSLVIESADGRLQFEFPETKTFDLFAHCDVRAPQYAQNGICYEDFVQITEDGEQCWVEASSGTLYDFFRERMASGRCSLHHPKPVAFRWSGAEEDAA